MSKEAVDALEPFALLANKYDPPEDDDHLIPWDFDGDDLTLGHLRRARTVYQALRTEAGDERAAIVAWLRSVADEQKGLARRLQREDSDYARHSIPACTECARHYDDAAYAIERGDHLKSPPSQTRDDNNAA